MTIAVLTATYNRAKDLPKLYKSLIANKKNFKDFKWYIMDDGSGDNTKTLINDYIKEGIIDIDYHYQENKGKMQAINNLLPLVKEDIIIEMDSDDYFLDNGLAITEQGFKSIPKDKNVYGVVFYRILKGHDIKKMSDLEGQVVTLYDMHYKYGYDYDKAIVFKADIRKKYPYILENNEKFTTEARTYHQMDLVTDGLYVYGSDIMVCEYQPEGYTNNIKKIFTKYPFGYYQYFLELLNYKHHGILFKKRLYMVKHYILFATLTKVGFIKSVKRVKPLLNKLLVMLLYLPGKIVTLKRWR